MVQDYTVWVTTGDFQLAGTNASVSITLVDKNGDTSGPHMLFNIFRNDFSRGSTHDFGITVWGTLYELAEIEIHYVGIIDHWSCDRIEVQGGYQNKRYVFPVHRWFSRSTNLKIAVHDSQLAQYSPHPEQRRLEIEDERLTYQYKQNFPEAPVQIKMMPFKEAFSDEYTMGLVIQQFSLVLQRLPVTIIGLNRDFKSFQEIIDLFDQFPSLDPPPSTKKWKEDTYFGEQRLTGCNPTLIELCTEIPAKFKVDATKVKPYLEGATLASAMKNKRIFMTDLKILEGITTVNDTVLCAPMALFYHTNANEFIPLAIQLFQYGDKNPVFYPSDEQNLWQLVKMWYGNADANYHQSAVHLGNTHLLMEGIWISVKRTMSMSHPITRLLAPHFLYLISINTLAVYVLVSPGGWVDKTMTVGRDGMLQLVAKRHKEFSITTDGDLKNDLKRRGLLEDILPHYYYKKDGLRLYDIINKYVDKVVRTFYKDVNDIKNDFELQNWAKELSAAKQSSTGNLVAVGLNDVPGQGKFDNFEDLIAVCRNFIFIGSVQHAAVNFNQYDNYSFTPAYPAIMYGQPPSDKLPRTEQDLLGALPTRNQTTDIMTITKTLSTRGTQALGDFEVQYQHHPEALVAVNEFKADLAALSQQIYSELPSRPYDYSILDAQVVPNAISI